METIKVICPACGQQVEAVAGDGRVEGYCAIAKQYVDFVIEAQPGKGSSITVEAPVWLGHASIQITLDTYSHVAPSLQQAAANRFDDIVLPKNQDGSENETKEILRQLSVS